MQIKLLFSKNVFLAVKPFSALKESFREGYGKQKLIDWKEKLTIIEPNRRRVAQLGSATGLGPVGRRFKSYLADHFFYISLEIPYKRCNP